MAQATVTELFAWRVRRLRADIGWSAQRLADECARAGFDTLTRGTIAKIESGARKSVTAEEVAGLAKALGATPSDLLAAEPVPHDALVPRDATTLALVSPADSVQLREMLAGLPVPPLLVRRVVGAGIPPPERGANAWEVFGYLTEYNAGPDGVPPALKFVDLLAQQVDDPVRASLTEWVRTQAGRLRLETPPAVRRASTPRTTTNSCLHLMIVVQPDAPGGTRYLLSSWRQDDPDEWPPARGAIRRVTLDELEIRVDELVVEAERAWAGHQGAAALEFVLPRELLHLPVHRWHKEHDSGDPRPLCLDYRIVVRSLERMRSLHWHRVWRERWRSLMEDPSAGRVHFGEQRDIDEPYRVDALLSDPRWTSMVLAEPPPLTPRSGPGRDELTAALRSGIPALIWHPEAPPDALREMVARLAEDDGLADLPTRTQTSRIAALRSIDSEIAGGLVILWDDPTRLVVLDQQLRAEPQA